MKSRQMNSIVLCVSFILCNVSNVHSQSECQHRFYCDSLIRVFYGYTPTQITGIYEYSVKHHYYDDQGTLHLYRDILGQAYLEWKIMSNGDVVFGGDNKVRYKLCTELYDLWETNRSVEGISLMRYEGIVPYEVLGQPALCMLFRELFVFNPDSTGNSDTVATYLHYFHDSLGVISKVPVYNGSSFLVQGVQCAHGFYGDAMVGVYEGDLELARVQLNGFDILIPADSWGPGVFDIYLYDGSRISSNWCSGAQAQRISIDGSFSSHVAFWTYKSTTGRIHSGKLLMQN